MTDEAVEGELGVLAKLFGERGDPGENVVVPELAVVFVAEGALDEEEDGEVVGGEIGGLETFKRFCFSDIPWVGALASFVGMKDSYWLASGGSESAQKRPPVS